MNTTIKVFTIGLFLILVMALVAVPAKACETPPTCPPGEVWGQTGQHCYQVPAVYGPCQNCPYIQDQYGPWGSWESGKCPGNQESDTCDQEHVSGSIWHHRHRTFTEGHYQCHSEGYIPCDGAHHEKQIITPAHQQCDPVFGCIAVSCPAIPCEEGYSCIENQCVQNPPECTNSMGFRVSIPSSPDPTPYNIGTAPATVDFYSNPSPNIYDPFPVDTTFVWDFGDGGVSALEDPTHTYQTPGIYDVTLTVTFPEGCPVVVTETKEDYLLVTAPDGQVSTRSPFSSSEWSVSGSSCRAFFNDPDTMTGKELLAGRTYYVVLLYNSEIDGGQVCTYNELESLFSPDCSRREYYNNEPAGERQYGGGSLVFPVLNPSQKIGVLMVRGTGLGLPMTMMIVDAQSGAVMDSITTMGDKIQIAYPLIDDLSGCAPISETV